jgi:hypothetical protein
MVLEIHSSKWSVELEEYSVNDLMADGQLFRNPALIANVATNRAIRHMLYNFIPTEYFEQNNPKLLKGYCYIKDNNDGFMRVVTQVPV